MIPAWRIAMAGATALSSRAASRSQLQVPLDFMAVTDHDIWLGELSLCQDPTDPAYNTQACRDLRSADQDPKPAARPCSACLNLD